MIIFFSFYSTSLTATDTPVKPVIRPVGEVPYVEKLREEEKNLEPGLSRARKNIRTLISILKEQKDFLPKNILLVGQPGHGKSALINLLHSALRQRYEAITDPGDGYTASHTNHLLL